MLLLLLAGAETSTESIVTTAALGAIEPRDVTYRSRSLAFDPRTPTYRGKFGEYGDKSPTYRGKG